MTNRILVIVAILSLLLTPFTVRAQSCPVDEWWEDSGAHFVDFNDTLSVAEVTPKIQLAPMVLEMYRTLRAFQRNEQPDCLESTHEAIDTYMQSAITAFRNYMLDQGDEPDVSEFETALDRFEDVLNEFTSLGYLLDMEAGSLCQIGTENCP